MPISPSLAFGERRPELPQSNDDVLAEVSFATPVDPPTTWNGFHVLQHSMDAYEDTQARLRRFAAHDDWQMLACHCPHTQVYVG